MDITIETLDLDVSLVMRLDRKDAYKFRVKYCLLVNCFSYGDCANFSVITGMAN
jgi:hypothetical protein